MSFSLSRDFFNYAYFYQQAFECSPPCLKYITVNTLDLHCSVWKCLCVWARTKAAFVPINPIILLEVLCTLVHFPMHIPGQQVMHSIGHGWLHNRSLQQPLPIMPSSTDMSHRRSNTCDNHTEALGFTHISHLALHHINATNTQFYYFSHAFSNKCFDWGDNNT